MKARTHFDSARSNLWRILPAIVLLLLATLACQLNLGGPTTPTERPTSLPSGDWRSMLANAQPGQEVSFTISETELNNILPGEMQAGQGLTITDPSIALQDGEIQSFGQASNGMVSARFRADLDVNVDEGGRPRLQVNSADFGPMPVPSSLLDDLTTAVNDALLAAGGSTLERLRVTDITVMDGALSITGVVQ